MEMKMVQKMEIQDDIRGFSPTLTRALVKKLKKLKEEKRIICKNGSTTEIASTVIYHLSRQLWGSGFKTINLGIMERYANHCIETAEEFLAILEDGSK